MQQREKWKQRGSCSFKLLKANKSELTKWFRLNAAKGRSTFLQVSVVNDGLSKAGSPAGAGRRSPWLPDMAKLSRIQNEWVSADECHLLVKVHVLKRFEMQWKYARDRRPETHKSHSSRRASARPVLKRPSKHPQPTREEEARISWILRARFDGYTRTRAYGITKRAASTYLFELVRAVEGHKKKEGIEQSWGLVDINKAYAFHRARS